MAVASAPRQADKPHALLAESGVVLANTASVVLGSLPTGGRKAINSPAQWVAATSSLVNAAGKHMQQLHTVQAVLCVLQEVGLAGTPGASCLEHWRTWHLAWPLALATE